MILDGYIYVVNSNTNTTITHTLGLALVYAISFESLISVLDIAVLFNQVSRPSGVFCQYATPSSSLSHFLILGFVLLSFFLHFFNFFIFRERERERERVGEYAVLIWNNFLSRIPYVTSVTSAFQR